MTWNSFMGIKYKNSDFWNVGLFIYLFLRDFNRSIMVSDSQDYFDPFSSITLLQEKEKFLGLRSWFFNWSFIMPCA